MSVGEVEAAEANEKLVESLTEDPGTRLTASCLHADMSGWLQRQLPPDMQAPAGAGGQPGVHLRPMPQPLETYLNLSA